MTCSPAHEEWPMLSRERTIACPVTPMCPSLCVGCFLEAAGYYSPRPPMTDHSPLPKETKYAVVPPQALYALELLAEPVYPT